MTHSFVLTPATTPFDPSNSNTLRIISTVSHQDVQDWTLVSVPVSETISIVPQVLSQKIGLCLFREKLLPSFCYSQLNVHNLSSHTQPSLTDPGSPTLLKMQFFHDDNDYTCTVLSRSEIHSICRAIWDIDGDGKGTPSPSWWQYNLKKPFILLYWLREL